MRVKCNAEGAAASTACAAAGSNNEVNRFEDFEVWQVGKHFFDVRKIQDKARVGAEGVVEVIPPGMEMRGHVMDAAECVAAEIGVFHDEGKRARGHVVGNFQWVGGI